MSQFLYETHLHTSQASACGQSRGSDYIRRYLDLGYAGIFVTDHFFHGNSALSRRLPWKEWVKRFCAGYEDAWEVGDRLGLSVFFGWEAYYEGDEYLIYGPDKQWLLDRPEVIRYGRLEQFEQVHAAGGCVVQAHPFRDRWYIPEIHLSTGLSDAVEVANAGNEPRHDVLAARYARALGLPMTAGSDIHDAEQEGEKCFGVCFDAPLNSAHDYADRLRQRVQPGLRVPEGRLDWREDVHVDLAVDIRDARDRRTGRDVWALLGIEEEKG